MSKGNLAVNLVMVAGTLLMNLVLVYRRRMKKKKEALEAQLREFEFLEQLNKKYLLVEKEKQKDKEELQRSLRKKLECVRQALPVRGQGEGIHLTGLFLQDDKKNRIGDYCANSMVNIVMREKAGECAKQGSFFQAEVEVPQQLRISDYHLCSIFCNLIDNAIEACTVLPEQERRIFVTAKVYGPYLYIQVKNSCTEEHAKRPKREGHGLGMNIVKQTAEFYGGDFSTEFSGGEYRADVVIGV